jgi:hypothetical protein
MLAFNNRVVDCDETLLDLANDAEPLTETNMVLTDPAALTFKDFMMSERSDTSFIDMTVVCPVLRIGAIRTQRLGTILPSRLSQPRPSSMPSSGTGSQTLGVPSAIRLLTVLATSSVVGSFELFEAVDPVLSLAVQAVSKTSE